MKKSLLREEPVKQWLIGRKQNHNEERAIRKHEGTKLDFKAFAEKLK